MTNHTPSRVRVSREVVEKSNRTSGDVKSSIARHCKTDDFRPHLAVALLARVGGECQRVGTPGVDANRWYVRRRHGVAVIGAGLDDRARGCGGGCAHDRMDVRTDLALGLVERHQETAVLNGVSHGVLRLVLQEPDVDSRRRVGGDRDGIALGPCSVQCAGLGVALNVRRL